MTDTLRDLASVLLQATSLEWFATLSLVFGGCCSNAWALELATAQNPRAGTLITFAQFVLVALYGLRKHITVTPSRPAALERVANEIANVCSQGARDEAVYVSIEGATRGDSRKFAADLVDTLLAVSGIEAIIMNGIRDPVAHSSMGEGGAIQPDPIVLVVLTEPDESRHWDYTVYFVPPGTGDQIPARTRPSITIEQARPVFPRLRLTPRAIPLSQWATQVLLFLLTSLLNNAAFGYAVPMSVHIIFRSGGLVVNMLVGWLVGGRRYTAAQVVSVLLVTLGVTCTTLSATPETSAKISGRNALGSYFVGIFLLTLALVLSGLMGLAQDRAYERYGRGHWQEALFYLHFLALPGFLFVSRDILVQMRVVNASARVQILRGVHVPVFYAPLLLNIVTQLVCVTGVHRLTSRVNSLTVTLVLVVRKAVSLGISVLVLGSGSGRGGGKWLWGGAALVLVGTLGYAVGSPRQMEKEKKEK